MQARSVLLAGAALLAVPASAPAAVSRTLSAGDATARACHTKLASGARGTDSFRVTAPVSGLVRARARGAGDWDLGVFDARTRRSVAGSAAFGSNELADGYVTKGQRLVVQGCRYRGSAARVRVTVGFEALRGGSSSGARAAGSTARIQVVDVNTPDQAAKRRLQGLDLDLTEHGDADSVEAILWNDADARRLRDARFTYTVRITDLAARNKANATRDAQFAADTALTKLPSGRDNYRRLPDYEFELKQLAQRYPALVKPVTLPYKSREGRDVVGVEITRNPNALDGRPTFFLMGIHHAREWPAGENTIEFAYDLATNYGTSARTTALVDAARTIVVPIINPDGFTVSREARTGPASQDFSAHDYEMKRKNCSGAEHKCDRVSRLVGVDPNRNYGGLWGGAGASPFSGSDTYRGPAPFSEPEVRNVRDVVATRNVVSLITNHTYSNLLLRVPGTIDQGFPLEEPLNKSLGAAMASHNNYSNIPGFGLYDTTGGTEDWTFWTAGALSYTFEIGPTEFHPPYETGVVAEYLGLAPAAGAGKGGNREAYYEMLKATADASTHSLLTGSAPAGSKLSVSKTFTTFTSPVCADSFCTVVGPKQSFEDSLNMQMVTSGKTFAWHLNASTRPEVAGRAGRVPVASPQAGFALVNPAGHPDENVYYPDTAPSTVSPPYEAIPFEVKGLPEVDNGRFTVHIDWTDPANDWDVYVLDEAGNIVTQSAAFGDNTEDATLVDPPAGRYTAVVVNYDQVQRTVDDYRIDVRFQSPTPESIGTKEAWSFRCETPDGDVATRQVVIDRGQALDLGLACKRDK